jgi:nitrile hydratase accessory protein
VTLQAVDAGLAGTAPLPRSNGELVFDEPWQARALGMGVVTMRALGIGWAEWQGHLAAAIVRHGYHAAEPAAAAYYTAWVDALESLLAERGLQSVRAGDRSS